MTNLPDPVADLARRHGGAPAVVTPTQTWTWQDVERRTAVCARRLLDLAEPSSGARGVAVQAQTSPDLMLLVLGALRAGIVLVPISPRWPLAAVGAALGRLGLSRLVTDDDAEGAIALAPLVASDGTRWGGRDLDPANPFTVVHTSGSTGTPKAALHTVENHVASARGVIDRLDLRDDSRWWLDLPLEHVGGLGVVMRCVLAGAAVSMPARDRSLAENLDVLRPTHASLVPTQLARWCDAVDAGADVSSLRAVLIGGAATPSALIDRALAAGLPVCTSWGMTEMTATVTATAPDAPRDALATSGAPLSGRELRLGAPGSESPDANGQIWVRGASRFVGYLNGGLGGDLVEPFDADGWFDTGDIGRLDADDRLTITGRADLQFISGGENVQPEAIERVLRGVAGVAQAVVVPVPSARYGARPVAFIRPADGDVLPTALREVLATAVRAALPGFMVPDAFYTWRGADGLKPDRPALTLEAERRAAG